MCCISLQCFIYILMCLNILFHKSLQLQVDLRSFTFEKFSFIRSYCIKMTNVDSFLVFKKMFLSVSISLLDFKPIPLVLLIFNHLHRLAPFTVTYRPSSALFIKILLHFFIIMYFLLFPYLRSPCCISTRSPCDT